MKIIGLLLGSFASFVTVTQATVEPSLQQFQQLSRRVDCATTSGNLELPPSTASNKHDPLAPAFNNESYVLGWQLNGIFGTFELVPAFCETENYSKQTAKLRATGINTDAVRLPFCNRIGCDMMSDGYNIFLHLIGYVGGLFLSELDASVINTEENWLTLCNTLNPFLVGTFLGPNNTIVASVCSKAGVQEPPNPNHGTDNIPADAPDIIRAAAASLLAWQIIAFFQSGSDLKEICGVFPNYLPNIAALDLDPQLVYNTVCDYVDKPLPTVKEIIDNYLLFGSEIFAESLWSVSDSTEYRNFVCKGYQTGYLVNFKRRVNFYAGPAKKTFEEKISMHCSDVGIGV